MIIPNISNGKWSVGYSFPINFSSCYMRHSWKVD